MQWETHFVHAIQHMKRSAVRELLKLTLQPGMISFAGGLPAAELFPIDQVRQGADAVLACRGRKALQYGETEGVAELRDWIAAHYCPPGARFDRDNVLIVSGAQQALDLIGRVLLDPGDKVLVENPTYLALLTAWRPLGVHFVAATADDEGMRVDPALEQLLRARPKLIYNVPNFQNPTGTTLNLERRVALSEWLSQHSIPLVEDDPYRELRYEGEPLPSLLQLDAASANPGQVIQVGTFSKVLSPGLRVGWVIAPPLVIDKLVQAKQAADLHTSTLTQHIVLELLERGVIQEQVPRLRAEYRIRRDAMLEALKTYLPRTCTWTRPEGGMFLILRLPPQMDGAAVLREALPRNVAFVPGEEFHLDGMGRDTIRLNFTNATAERIVEGVRRLGQVLQSMPSSHGEQ